MNLFNTRKLSLITLLLIPIFTFANIIPANPSNYRALLTGLEPGDILQLSSGVYDLGLPVYNRHGNSAQPIIITGPETGAPAVFTGDSSRNTVQIDESSYIILRHITLDGLEVPYVDGVNSRGPTHHITIENLLIINHGGAYVPDTDHQLTNGIATRGPAWDWTIRNNTIIGAGTGMYLGSSNGKDWPFVGGLIEHNLIVDTLGYNMQIKHMISRDYRNGDPVPGMPTVDRKTIIRHNVFSKENNSSISGTWARPNFLVGHWPLTGAGSNDIYEIYGNFVYSNPAEALFQGEGNIAMYDNVLVNHSGSAVHFQSHNHKPRTIRVFHNSIVANGTGIRVTNVDSAYEQLVTGNAIFAATPLILSGQVQQVDNISDTFNAASNYLNTPFGDPNTGTLDLYPITASSLSGAFIDSSVLQLFNDWDSDFNGNQRLQGFRGAYADEGSNPGWQLELTNKPINYTASNGAADIFEEPVSLSALEGETASFNVRVSGVNPIQYQWFRNGSIITGATASQYTINPVLADDNNAIYHCEVSNNIGGDISADAVLTVLPDTAPPSIKGVVPFSSNEVGIQFTKAVTSASAQTIANYQIDKGIQVLSAVLSADNKTVRLQTSSLATDTDYTVTLDNIQDTTSSSNLILPGSKISIWLEPNMDLANDLLPLNWVPLNSSRWSIFDDNGNNALFLNTSSYNPLSGSRLGEYILSPDSYGDFTLTVEAKTNEPSNGNPNADYALVFGFVDADNYYYMLFNKTQSNTVLFRVIDGGRREMAIATTGSIPDNEYHTLKVSRLVNEIEVRFDDTIVLQVSETTFLSGQIGLGSFNDSVYFDDIRITTGIAAISDLIFSNAFE